MAAKQLCQLSNEVLLVSSYKYVYMLFNVNFLIIYKYSHHNFMLSLTLHMSVTPRLTFLSMCVVYNISELHVSEFAMHVAYLFGAPLW